MRTRTGVLGMKRLVLMLPKMIIPRVLNTRSKTGVLRAQIRNTMCGHRLRSCEARKKERKRERLLISLGVCTRALEIFFFISSAHTVYIKNCRFETHTKNRGRNFFPILLLLLLCYTDPLASTRDSLPPLKKGDRCSGYTSWRRRCRGPTWRTPTAFGFRSTVGRTIANRRRNASCRWVPW